MRERPAGSGRPDLPELCAAAMAEAAGGEAVEAFAEEDTHVQVRARAGEVESLSFSESRGVGVRVIVDERLGYAYAADPEPAEVAELVLAAGEGQTGRGWSLGLARGLGGLDVAAGADEAAERAARLLGGRKPASARLPVVLDPAAAAAFLSVLSGALSAEAVQKGRSPLAMLVGQAVGSDAVTLVDDGRLEGAPATAPFDGEGVATGRTTLVEGG